MVVQIEVEININFCSLARMEYHTKQLDIFWKISYKEWFNIPEGTILKYFVLLWYLKLLFLYPHVSDWKLKEINFEPWSLCLYSSINIRHTELFVNEMLKNIWFTNFLNFEPFILFRILLLIKTSYNILHYVTLIFYISTIFLNFHNYL